MTELVRDDFTRTAGSGSPGSLGSAHIGGPWTVSVSAALAGWRVNGSSAVADFAAGTGGTANAILATAVPATEAHAAMSCRSTVDSMGMAAAVWLRASGTSASFAGYGARIWRPPSGVGCTLELLRGPNDAAIVMATSATFTWPGTYASYVTVELELVGASPTTVRARWFASSSPPTVDTGWLTVSDATGSQAAGAYGMRVARAGAGNTVVGGVAVASAYVTDRLAPAFTSVVGDDGLSVVFNSSTLTTGSPTGHSWAFGDGSPAVTTQDATHVYAAAGTYSVTYTATSRWGTKRSSTQSVVVPGAVDLPVPAVKPSVYLNGEDVCDRVFAADWSSGRSRWPDDTNGSSCTLQVRGRMADVVNGAPLVIAVPPGAPDGGRVLYTGEVDSIVESLDPTDAKTVTTITAMDTLSWLGRYHILPGTSIAEGTLPTRTASLAPRGSTVYRQKWAGVPAGRWPTLKALSSTTDKLRTKTYLDLLRDGLRGSLATAYTAPDGAIVYAPLDPPADLGYGTRIIAGTHAPKPQSHWRLGETAGNMYDSMWTPQGVVGGAPLRGVPSIAPGDTDGALGATGNTSVTFGDVYSKNAASRWSVAAWTTWAAGETYFWNKLSTAGGLWYGWRTQLTTTGQLRAYTGNGGATLDGLTAPVGTAIAAGSTHHIAFTFGTTWRAYIDGVEVASRAMPAVIATSTQTSTANIGAGSVLDELSMWSVELTGDQVRAAMTGALDLDEVGPDCPSHVDVERATADGMVNRWTSGGDPPAVDRVERVSIEAYGESVWSVSTGVLKTDSTFPVTDEIAEVMREPFPARTVLVPLRSWSSRSHLAQPLDMAQQDGELFAILGVRQRVGVGDWSVELALDRDPWTMSGVGVPAVPVTPTPARKATQTFLCDMDALLASPNMGAGRATRLPVGWNGSVKFRALIRFNLAWAHTPKKVLEADLELDTAGQDVVAYGGSPQIQIDRITGSWSEGSSGGDGPPWTFNTSNAVVYPGPAVTSSGRVTLNVSSGQNVALDNIGLTSITAAWAGGASNRGIRIISTNEASTSRTTEFYSSEYGGSSTRRPRLRVTYEY